MNLLMAQDEMSLTLICMQSRHSL